MLRCICAAVILVALAACDGGSKPVHAAAPLRLRADDVTIPAGAVEAAVPVRLEGGASGAPVLLQCDLELPQSMALAQPVVIASRPVQTLDAAVVNGRFRVVCGDKENDDPLPLAPGPLFTVRVRIVEPRTLGVHELRIVNVRAAARTGPDVPADAAPAVVRVTVE